MKRYIAGIIFMFLATSFHFKANAQCGRNYLNNGSFEAPEFTSAGTNPISFDFVSNWRIFENNAPASDRICHIIKPDGNAYSNGPDEAVEGSQYFSLKNDDGIIYQDFTVTTTQQVSYSGFFSSKDQSVNYVNWTAKIEIIDIASNAILGASNTKDFDNANGFTPAQEKWYQLSGNILLPAGNYRFLIHLGQFGNFDAAFLGSSCALANSGMLLKGNYAGDKILLQWTSAVQSEEQHFTIEKSSNGKDFEAIGYTLSSTTGKYNFTDIAPLKNAKNYYRIKKTGRNGNFIYSEILLVTSRQNLQLVLYPNPVQEQLIVSGIAERGNIAITDMTGRVLIKQPVTDAQSLSINVAALIKGTYFLRYSNDRENITEKFSKQ